MPPKKRPGKRVTKASKKSRTETAESGPPGTIIAETSSQDTIQGREETVHTQHSEGDEGQRIDAAVTLSASSQTTHASHSSGTSSARKNKVTKLKAYPSSLKDAIEHGDALRANRRGIVELNSDSDKPTVTAAELVQLRRQGLSYKQIGRKVGIDPHRDEVLQVYDAIKEETHLDIEKDVKAPAKVSPSNPLWYTFRSERDVIARNVMPTREHVLNLGVQHRVKERLGDHAGFMLGMYRQVSKIVHEEILSTLDGAPYNSPIGQLRHWIGDMPSSMCKTIFGIEEAVGEEAFELTEYWENPQGRCKCSAIKVIRFGWKSTPIPYPSFFWGCSNYTPIDGHNHDKGVPMHKQTCWTILKLDSPNRGKSAHISDNELERLSSKFVLADDFWSQQMDDELEDPQLLKAACKYYGGPPDDLPLNRTSSVQKVVNALREQIKFLKDERATAAMIENESQ